MKIIKISLVIALTATLNSTAAERGSLLKNSVHPYGYGTIDSSAPYQPLMNIQQEEADIMETGVDLATLEAEIAIADDLSNSIELLEQSRLATSSHVRKEGTDRDRTLLLLEGIASNMIQSLTEENRELLKRRNLHQYAKNLLDHYLQKSKTINQDLRTSKGLFGKRSSSAMASIDEKFNDLNVRHAIFLSTINDAVRREQEATQEEQKAIQEEQEKVFTLEQIQNRISNWFKEFRSRNATLTDDTYNEVEGLLKNNNLIGERDRRNLTALFNYFNENYEQGCDYLNDESIVFWNRKTN